MYDTPAVPPANEVVVIVSGGGAITRGSACGVVYESCGLELSVTVRVTWEVPAVGIPLSNPVVLVWLVTFAQAGNPDAVQL